MHLEEALINFDKAYDLQPDNVEINVNRGILLKELRRVNESLSSLDRAYYLNPDYDYLKGARLHTKMFMCDWDDFKTNLIELATSINSNKKSTNCLTINSLIDSLEIQQKVAQIWMNDKHPYTLSTVHTFKSKSKEKIKIGYFSADFREHPVSYAIAELLELHNKNKFEIIGFYFGPPSSGQFQDRIASHFDQLMDVRLQSDKEIAQLSRDMGIDIAVDLTGNMQYGRMGIFTSRAAPLQLSYLGFLGTIGSQSYDYLIADKIIIPNISQHYYTEKIVYLPNYMVYDTKTEISSKVFSRSELNLPDNGFIFCSFNNNYKITPTTFDSWMRILNKVPCSVLFIYADNQWAEQNLLKEAEKRGVNRSRLVFGARISRSEHLARYKTVDLFLDTLPCNAGATACDALWAGLPVLTCSGESFASRMAASLLTAIELSELITTSQAQYEFIAVDLATNPNKYKEIKDRLNRNRLTTALFDTPKFTKNIEAAFIEMHERNQASLPPDHIYIERT